MLFGHQDGGGGGLGPTDKSIFCKSSIYFRAGPSVFLREPKALWKLIRTNVISIRAHLDLHIS